MADEMVPYQAPAAPKVELKPLYVDGEFVAWVTPEGMAMYKRMMMMRMGTMDGMGMMPQRTGAAAGEVLETAVDAGVAIFEFLKIGELDDSLEDARRARRDELDAHAKVLTAAGATSQGLRDSLDAYFKANERVQRAVARSIEIQLKCLWASALSSGASTLSKLWRGVGGSMEGSMGWVVGGIAAGGFLIAEVFSRDRDRGEGRRNRR